MLKKKKKKPLPISSKKITIREIERVPMREKVLMRESADERKKERES